MLYLKLNKLIGVNTMLLLKNSENTLNDLIVKF